MVPLKFEVSAAGLRLTDPKSGVSTLFPYHAAPVNLCSVAEPFLGATLTNSVASLSVRDILPSFSLLPAPFTPTYANVCDSSVVTPTKGDVFFTFPAASATKGDDCDAFLAASTTKGDV